MRTLKLVLLHKIMYSENKKKYFKERYRQRKEHGLCTKCGKPAMTNKTLCKECAEKNKNKYREDREFFKTLGLCPKCGKNKLFGSEKTCPECLAYAEKIRDKHAIKTAGSKEAYNKQVYQKARQRCDEQNLCIKCKKNKRANGHVHCEECLEKRRIKAREIRKKQKKAGITRSERPTYGLCYCCGKPLDREGKRCIKCAAKVTNNLPRIKATEHWKKDNNLIFVGGKQDDKIQK